MQRLCFENAQLLAGDMGGSEDKQDRARLAVALGNLARNWTALQESIRVLKGEPLPGSYKAEKPKSKQERHTGAPIFAPPEE